MGNGGRQVSVWSGSNIVARRVVIAGDKGVAAVTFDDRAPNFSCCSPNNLSVVGAVLPGAATIICIIIPLLFIYPCTNSFCSIPTSATPPEYILSEWTIRMLKQAISPSFPCISTGIICKLDIPFEWRDSHLPPCLILWNQKSLNRSINTRTCCNHL
jgi:hypothetical protein